MWKHFKAHQNLVIPALRCKPKKMCIRYLPGVGKLFNLILFPLVLNNFTESAGTQVELFGTVSIKKNTNSNKHILIRYYCFTYYHQHLRNKMLYLMVVQHHPHQSYHYTQTHLIGIRGDHDLH